MDLTFKPATSTRFADVEEMLGPKKRPDAIACWCLTYRLGAAESATLDAPARRARMRALCGRSPAPGILAYDGDEVVGWAAAARRSQVAELADEEVYPRVDDADPWTIFCLRTRGGRRRRGIGTRVLAAAIDFARDRGATIIEAYPLDTNRKTDPIHTYPGLRAMFEREGFTKVAETGSVLGGARRIVMRLEL